MPDSIETILDRTKHKINYRPRYLYAREPGSRAPYRIRLPDHLDRKTRQTVSRIRCKSAKARGHYVPTYWWESAKSMWGELFLWFLENLIHFLFGGHLDV